VGTDPLIRDLLELIHGGDQGGRVQLPGESMFPMCWIKLAKRVNPF
jgi:hypothetical protein